MDSHEGRCTAARAALLTGELEMADLHLRAARSLAESPQHRAEVLVMQIRLAVLQGDVDGLLVAEALGFVGEIADAAPVVAGEVLLEVVVLELYGEHGGVVDRAHRARQLVASSDDPILQARADVLLGLARAFTGSVTEAETLLARSLDLIRLGGPPDEVAHTLQQVVVGLAGREMYAEAAALCRRSIRAARAVGAVGLLPLMLCFLANTVYFVGEFAEQEMAAAEALGLAAASGQLQLVTYAKVCRGVAMAVRGDTETARRDLEAALVELDETGGRTFRNLTLMGLALLEFSAADWPRAVEGYARLRRNWERDSTIPGILHWRGDEIEALWRSGDHKAARDRLAELIADATEYGPWEQAVIARLEGLTGAPASAEARFAEALEWHARGTSPFEEARTRLCWGEWLLSQGHPTRARRHLEQARDRFGELDTPLWRARTERLLAEADASHPETLPRRSVPSRHRVVAFGPLTVTGPEGTPVRVALDTPGNLLRLLVVEGGSVRAEHAVDRLWPDTSLADGRARLRTVLSRARSRYGAVVTREGAVLRWTDGVDVDAHRFEALHRRVAAIGAGAEAAALAREAIALYGQDLLMLERYDDEVVVARERMRQHYLDLLDVAATFDRSSGSLQTAADLLRAGVERDRLNEVRYFELAEVLLEQGRTGSARSVLEQARAVLLEIDMPVPHRLTALLSRC